VIIIGGDITGKDLIYIVQDLDNGIYYSTDRGEPISLNSKEEAEMHEKKAADSGSYIHWCRHAEYLQLTENKTKQNELLKKLIEERVKEWIVLAEKRLITTDCVFIMNTGNDDFFSVDQFIKESTKVIFAEGRSILLNNGINVVSCGYANQTPFHCPRDIKEEDLFAKIESYIQTYIANGGDMNECILNLHCPPINTKLDIGPKLDAEKRPQISAFGKEKDCVGSVAVRKIIEKYQPLLGLHGHIHESPGVDTIEATVILNPGSEYQSGILKFAVIDFEGKKINKNFLRTAT
jgi:Icc-related predicted phosphoesterase